MTAFAATDAAAHAEHAFVCSLLRDRDAIAAVANTLTPDAIAHPQYRAVFRACLNLWDQRIPPDFVTVGHELHRMGAVRGAIPPWDVLIGMTVGGEITAVHVEYYADLVVRYAKQRAMAAVGSDVVLRAHRGDTDAEAALVEARRRMEAFGAVADDTPPTYADLILAQRERTLALWDGSLVERTIPTGIAGLDRTLGGGFRPGELNVLGGRPGMGKSVLMMHMAHAAALSRPDHTVAVFSLEMTRTALLERAITSTAGLPYGVGTKRHDDHTAKERWLTASARLEDLPVTIDDTRGLSTGSMQLRVERLRMDQPVSLVVVDHLDHVGDDVKAQMQTHKLSEILKRLLHLAQVCDVSVLLLSQLNRAVELRESKVPQLSDFKDSGSLEEKADVALLLFRRRYYSERGMLPDDPDKDYLPRSDLHRVSLICAKNRNGSPDSISLGWDARHMRFQEVP